MPQLQCQSFFSLLYTQAIWIHWDNPRKIHIGGHKGHRRKGKGYTQFTIICVINSSIKGMKSIMQTKIGLPRVHILLVTHFLCLIELSVCTSVKKKKR